MARILLGYLSPNLLRYHARYATALGSKLANVQNANAHPARVCVATANPVHQGPPARAFPMSTFAHAHAHTRAHAREVQALAMPPSGVQPGAHQLRGDAREGTPRTNRRSRTRAAVASAPTGVDELAAAQSVTYLVQSKDAPSDKEVVSQDTHELTRETRDCPKP